MGKQKWCSLWVSLSAVVLIQQAIWLSFALSKSMDNGHFSVPLNRYACIHSELWGANPFLMKWICFSTEESLSASVTSQPSHQKENVLPLLVTSTSDQFLTTPDGDEKDVTQENSELKHRSSKKDLLEIDRFTICGNRIDWVLWLRVPKMQSPGRQVLRYQGGQTLKMALKYLFKDLNY